MQCVWPLLLIIPTEQSLAPRAPYALEKLGAEVDQRQPVEGLCVSCGEYWLLSSSSFLGAFLPTKVGVTMSFSVCGVSSSCVGRGGGRGLLRSHRKSHLLARHHGQYRRWEILESGWVGSIFIPFDPIMRLSFPVLCLSYPLVFLLPV